MSATFLASFQPDPGFRDEEMPEGAQLFFTCFTGVPLLIMTGLAVYLLVKRRAIIVHVVQRSYEREDELAVLRAAARSAGASEQSGAMA